MEYKCDMCGKPATVHITKIINGKKTKLHLCQECAQKGASVGEGFPMEILPGIKALEEQMLEVARSKRQELSCPKCKTTLSAFDKRGRFTCPECYKAFQPKVLDMLAQMHGAVAHKGKRPKHTAATVNDLQNEEPAQIEIPFDAPQKSDKLPEVHFEDIKFTPAPPSPQELLTELKSALVNAVKEERYEDAARIRDDINEIEKAEK